MSLGPRFPAGLGAGSATAGGSGRRLEPAAGTDEAVMGPVSLRIDSSTHL